MSGEERAPKTAKEYDKLLKAMTEAHTDLNIFEACIAILEGGTVSSDAQPYDFKVIELCRKAEQQCLRRFDRARDALRSRASKDGGGE